MITLNVYEMPDTVLEASVKLLMQTRFLISQTLIFSGATGNKEVIKCITSVTFRMVSVVA